MFVVHMDLPEVVPSWKKARRVQLALRKILLAWLRQRTRYVAVQRNGLLVRAQRHFGGIILGHVTRDQHVALRRNTQPALVQAGSRVERDDRDQVIRATAAVWILRNILTFLAIIER